MDKNAQFPIDWNEWRSLWNEWRTDQIAIGNLKRSKYRFPGKNLMADEILGVWNVNGRTVELSETTFPNLSERDERGFLKHFDVRGIGVTYGVGTDADATAGGICHTFAELEEELFGD